MTSDRARKKAARAEKAATGQSYVQARRSVQRPLGSAAEPVAPPPIEPGEHAVHSQRWGDQTRYLVRYQGRYYTWGTDAGVDGRPRVHRVDGEQDGRALVDQWQAENVLHVAWEATVAHIFLMDPGAGHLICYEATVADVEDDGLWLACRDQTVAEQTSHVLERFTELEPALAAFADRAEVAAGQAERNQTLSVPEVLAGVLRYRAAVTRSEVARARLGDALRARRSEITGGRGLSPVLRAAGLDRDRLEPVLAGREFAWPTGSPVRPPGSRRPDTPVTRLAEYTVGGQSFALLCYVDSAGARCVAVEHDGRTSVVQDVPVNEDRLVNQGSVLSSARGGPGVIYGRAHDSVTALYSTSADGQRTDWPVHDDPRTGERYFIVAVVPETVADIVAEAPGRRVSLQAFFDRWFNPPDRRPRWRP